MSARCLSPNKVSHCHFTGKHHAGNEDAEQDRSSEIKGLPISIGSTGRLGDRNPGDRIQVYLLFGSDGKLIRIYAEGAFISL
jgi:hypothetical protein